MTRQLIVDNLNRILTFYQDKNNPEMLVRDISALGLLDVYSRLLDVYGAPARNLSRLYLTDEVWDSFKEQVKNIPVKDLVEFGEVNCLFSYLGYHWEVMNTDGVKRYNDKVVNLIKNDQ